MTARSVRTVVLLSAPGTLKDIDRRVRRAGVRLVRFASVMPRPTSPANWLERLARSPKPDTVVVTSRTGVRFGVRTWRRNSGAFPSSLEFWAVGPGTAEALRQTGVRHVRRPRTVGAMAIVKSLGRGSPRRVVHFRSALAGPGLARALRDQGHRVVDLVVYRLEEPPRLPARARREIVAADILVVTSSSGLIHLRRRLDRTNFARLLETTRLVVLGERSRRVARDLGFRHVSVTPSTTAQRFTRHLLRELRDARS